MKRILVLVSALLSLVQPLAQADSSLGLGLRVFRTVDSLPRQFTEMGLGGSVSWRTFWTERISGQLEMNLYEDGYAGAPQEALSPQAFVLLGREWYAGLGAGILFADGDLADAPFLVLRAGYQRPWTEWMSLDLSVSYEYAEWKGVNQFDKTAESDTLVFGAGVRVNF